MRLKWIVLSVLCAMLLLSGCANEKPMKQKARAQWSRARANVLFGLAKDQYATGNFGPARKTVEEAKLIDPEHEPLRVLSAKLAIEAGQLELADKELTVARKLNPRDAQADYLSGVVQQRWQKPESALEYYSSASEKDPSELAYVLAKSEMLVSANRQDEALRLLQDKVVFFENSAVIRDAVGQLLMQHKRYGEAADMLRQASILATDDITITEHLAVALYFAGRYGEAIDPLQKVLKREQYAKRTDLLLVLGRSQLEIGKARDARATLEKAVHLNDTNAAVWLSLARTAMQLNDMKRADLSLRRAQALEPDSSEVRLLMGYLRLKQNKLEEALASFQRASTLDTRDTVSLCMIGYTLKQLGRNDEAARYYAKALKIKPGDDMAKRLLATVPLD